MEVIGKIGKFTVKFNDIVDEKDLFEKSSGFEEIFGRNNKCKCGSDDVSLNFRIANGVGKNAGKKFKYYEKICNACGLRFPYGQTDNNKLFPKYDPGWHRYVAPTEEEQDESVKKGKK